MQNMSRAVGLIVNACEQVGAEVETFGGSPAAAADNQTGPRGEVRAFLDTSIDVGLTQAATDEQIEQLTRVLPGLFADQPAAVIHLLRTNVTVATVAVGTNSAHS